MRSPSTAAIIEQARRGYADLGNDSLFAPVFASTNPDVPQREQDAEQARQLLSDAGMPDGFNVKMNAIRTGEVPQYAQIVQDSAKEIGVNIELVIQDPTTYYGDAVFGSSPWLDSVMSLVDYGHRGVPNVLLGAPLLSDGVWNAAHFKNQQYDDLVVRFFREPDIGRQQELAGEIQTLLLDETPIIFAYFYNILHADARQRLGRRADSDQPPVRRRHERVEHEGCGAGRRTCRTFADGRLSRPPPRARRGDPSGFSA